MTSHQRAKKGKKLAESSGGSVVVHKGNDPIMIADQDIILTIERNKIQGTTLQRANFDGRYCVAISKGLMEAISVHNTLNKCDHPNIVKSIGVWTDPSDDKKAYIVLGSVNNTLSSLEQEKLFCIENGSLHGFTEFGFKVFMDIFSAVQYINNKYVDGATSSGNDSLIQLFPLMLRPHKIFINGHSQVMVGDFQLKLSDNYIRKNRKKNRQETTKNDIEAAHWKEVGHSLKSLCGDLKLSLELKELVVFLTEKAVTYDDLLWQPGIWKSTIKMEFIREIIWLLDEEKMRETDPYETTTRGKVLMKRSPLGLLELMKMFSPPKDKNNNVLEIKDAHLLDSVLFLRHKIVAHYDEEYPHFDQELKNEIGKGKDTVERFVQKQRGDYMIKLAKTIRELGWIAQAPVMRDENYYMETFYQPKK